MVGMPVVGQVGVAVKPTFSGVQKQIGSQFTGAGSQAGSSFNNSFTRALTTGAKVAATAGIAALGTTLAQGFGRLTAMEDAKAALAGLGYEAQDVNKIMGDVEGALNDTIFRYADGASVAAGALASGIEQGEELEGYLRLTADAATQAGVDFNSMGQIMNRVSGDGRLMGDTVQQLAENGIYVLPMLAEEFGVTQSAVREMVSAGEVDAATFQRVMEENVGGSAARASETTRGALSLAWASVGQLGEALLTDLMPHIRGAAQAFTEFMYSIQPVAAEIGARLIPVVTGLFEFLGNNIGLVGALATAVAAGTAAWVAFRGAMAAMSFVSGGVQTMMALTDAVRGFSIAARGTESAAIILRNSSQAAQGGAAAFSALGAPMRAARDATEGFRLAQSGMTTGLSLANTQVRAGAGLYRAYAPVANAAAGAQRAFNMATMNVRGALVGLGGVMRAHPLITIATAVAGAAAGLAYFFTQTETGQKIWENLKETMQPVVDTVMPMLQEAGSAIGDAFVNLAETAAPILSNIISTVAEFAAAILPTLVEIGGTILEALMPVFQAIGEYLAPMLQQIMEALAPLAPMFAEAGQQILEAFAPVVDQVMAELVPAFMELWEALAGIIPQLIESLAPILPIIADAFGMLVAALAPIVPMLVQALMPILPPIVEGFMALVGALSSLVPLMVEAIAPIIPVVVEAFTALLSAILPLVPMLIGSLVPVLVQLITLFADLVASLAPLVVAIIEAVIPAILSILPVFMQLVTMVIELVIPVIQEILNVVVTVFEALAPIISAALTVVQGVIQTITALITGDWSGAWDGIKMILSGTWELMKSIVSGAINVVWQILSSVLTLISELWSTVWNALATVLTWVWERLIQPVFRALGEFLKWIYDTFISPVIDWIMDKWDTMSSALRSVYNSYIKPMFDRFGEIVQDLRDKFDTAVSNIGKAWEKLKEVAAKPIHFVIQRVLNEGLIGGFNKLVDWIPGVDGLSDIPIPGWMSEFGYAAGGYTGPGRKYDPAGVVHAGEFVFQQTATNKLMRRFGLSGLNYMNETGELPNGYSSGGLVQPVNGHMTSGFGPRGGGHHAGIDWAVPVGTPVAAAMAGTVARAAWNAVSGRTGMGMLLNHPGDRQTYYGHLSAFRANVGDEVSKGQTIALSGNTGRSTGPHLHFETWSGGQPLNPANFLSGAMIPEGDGSGGGFDILAPFRAIGDKITGWISDQFPDGGIMVDAGIGAAKHGFDTVLEWAQDAINSIGDFFSGGDTGEGHAAGAGGIKGQVQDVAAQYGWGSGVQWAALEDLIQRESSWNLNAANPTSSARGLFQQMTSIHGPVASDAAGQARWGLNYIQGRYGSPAGALAHHNRNNWYADGGLVKPDNYLFRDRGGNLPQGLSMILNNRGHDETIIPDTPANVESAFLGQRGQAGVTIHGDVLTQSPEQFADVVETRRRRAAALAPVL